jgi:hypothetical protein
VPPLAVSVAVHELPTVAPGSELTVIDNVVTPSIVNLRGLDIAPLLEFITATLALPALSISVLEIDALS